MTALSPQPGDEEVGEDLDVLGGLFVEAVVLAGDEVELGIDKDMPVFFAAPQRHYFVIVAVENAHRTAVGSGRFVNLKILCGKQILPAELEHAETLYVLGRVLGIELVAEEAAGLARLLDDRAGSQEHQCRRAFTLASQHTGKHTRHRASL